MATFHNPKPPHVTDHDLDVRQRAAPHSSAINIGLSPRPLQSEHQIPRATRDEIAALTLAVSLARLSFAQYTLQDDYSGAKFLNGFSFFTEADPTEGYVDYVDGTSSGLFSQSGGKVKLSVDSSNVASGRGRKSVRLTSKASYNHALIVIDVGHMPANICGVWPAFWSTGPSWPSNGEIDIIEGVNLQSTNKITLHTDPGCTINGKDCQGSQGCSVDSGPYGDKINSAGGATYALEWTSEGMSIWGWAGEGAPSDALGKAPDPSGWGTPTASFPSGSSCNVDTFFKDQQIIFDTTFCGVWAGEVWTTDPQCSSLAPTCQEYVQNNPKAFADAYWTINALKVYTNGDGSTSSGSTSGSTGNTGNTGNMGNTVEESSSRVGAQPPSTIRPPAGVPTTVDAPVANPIPTGRTGGGRTWGGGRGGRGGRGAVRKEKRKLRVRGRHMKHLIIETSDRDDGHGQSVILDSAVPALGEELKG
ncbi:MAG: hypothetical protein L6R42_006782 [Xanthoria sp. 1 TBL-2021]|nr:MAG: hypothetical protein L6R42_006782 [Xanthoria sp. 1 TBL-2021]